MSGGPKARRAKALPRRIVLEKTTAAEILATKAKLAKQMEVRWQFHAELERQRALIKPAIDEALVRAARPFAFEHWQRAVKYRYSLHPLSAVGSRTGIGGRFNIGDIEPLRFAPFSALYVAEDKQTALDEALCPLPSTSTRLTPHELALMNPQSETIVSVSGEVEMAIDLRRRDSMKKLVELIKGFRISHPLQREASRAGISLVTVRTVDSLFGQLFEPNWRAQASLFDLPATSQVFGQLVCAAGIEAIIYPSKHTGKSCLTLFPKNLAVSTGWIALDDQAPHRQVPTRIDSTNWRLCESTVDDLID